MYPSWTAVRRTKSRRRNPIHRPPNTHSTSMTKPSSDTFRTRPNPASRSLRRFEKALPLLSSKTKKKGVGKKPHGRAQRCETDGRTCLGFRQSNPCFVASFLLDDRTYSSDTRTRSPTCNGHSRGSSSSIGNNKSQIVSFKMLRTNEDGRRDRRPLCALPSLSTPHLLVCYGDNH